jgi:hypothetical protein
MQWGLKLYDLEGNMNPSRFEVCGSDLCFKHRTIMNAMGKLDFSAFTAEVMKLVRPQTREKAHGHRDYDVILSDED